MNQQNDDDDEDYIEEASNLLKPLGYTVIALGVALAFYAVIEWL